MAELKGKKNKCTVFLAFSLTIGLSSNSVNAVLDWSDTMPETTDHRRGNPSQNTASPNPPAEPQTAPEPFDFGADQPTNNLVPAPFNNIDSSDKDLKKTVESFSNEWGGVSTNIDSTNEQLPESATQARKLNNFQYEPIWRPYYSQVTLSDFSPEDCCTRVLNSSVWEAELKCTDTGQRVWQVGVIAFEPEAKPVRKLMSCYIMSKDAVGNAWHYSCTAKAQVKCYDPNLNDNQKFLADLIAEEEAVESFGDEQGQTLPTLNTDIYHLTNRVPVRPKPKPPEDLGLPKITLPH